MEELTILLLIAIIVLIINFRSYVTVRLRKIESDILDLKKTPAVPLHDIPKQIPEEAIKTTPEKEEKDYWQSSFKVMDQPVATTQPEEIPEEEKMLVEPEEVVPEIIVQKEERRAFTPTPVIERKPTFFERNPDLEKFIGENLISKVGIAILVLAIGFFVKFAIDNDWIGPVGRVGIGVISGGILIFIAHKLRNSYQAFSSVMAGGGLAVFYFTITLAYHQFNLFNQTTAFIIMIVITAFAVVLSILYNRQELAVIAVVGGFAAPFLVSDGSGNYQVLFTYLIILNTGLLVLAYYKAWRLMNVLAFIFTVILFGGWLFSINDDTIINIYSNGLLFATCFYLLFFFINIANNIKENKRFIAADFSILLINTGLYFATGLYCLTLMNKPEYRGLFTILISVFNLVASYFLFRKRNVDTNILYLFIGITLTFISLTAPIQLHGHNITLFWASEAVLLYWLFKKSKISIIQIASFIIWFAMLASLLIDWKDLYSYGVAVRIILNKGFITGIYCSIATYILFILKNKTTDVIDNKKVPFPSNNVFRITGIVLLFLTGALEINYQYKYFFPNYDLNILYLQLYYFSFALLLLFINDKIAKTKLALSSQIMVLVSCIVFYIISLGIISALQQQLLQVPQLKTYFYACWVNAVLMIIILYRLIQIEKIKSVFTLINYEVVVWLTSAIIVVFLSLEFYWMANAIFYNKQNSFEEIQRVYIKTCLPVLWGLCSFGFMWLGMKYKFKPLRIISLVLFLITLIKLFAFDISNIPVGGKIAAFFCLGVLLLIVSFMYQRLKKIIIEDEEKKSA